MRKTRTEKGITLVALIVTIVVLLVLATVAISSIQNDGIISKAQDVANKFNEAQANEQNMLNEYLSYFEVGSEVPDELERYVLGPNKTGRPVTEVLDESTGMPKDEASTIPNASIAITIMSMSTNADSTKGILNIVYKDIEYEVVADLSTYYTESIKLVRKIEPGLIFEGEISLTEGTQTTIPGLVGTFQPTRKYKIDITINGESTIMYTYTNLLWGLVCHDGEENILMFSNTFAFAFVDGIILNSIYDVGLSEEYVEENGFYVGRNLRS